MSRARLTVGLKSAKIKITSFQRVSVLIVHNIRYGIAIRGGLLEHTVNVTLIADRLTQIYVCDQNLVLAGALLMERKSSVHLFAR
jgi:23S rRNA maturation-related 3'-5' exoribonuclease YhaM